MKKVHTMKINITSEKYDLDMEISYKLSLVNSHSGTGKTSIGKIFNTDREHKLKLYIDGKLDKEDRVVYINDANKQLLINIAEIEDVIILLDEINFSSWSNNDITIYNRLYENKLETQKDKSNIWMKVINQSKATIIIFNRDENVRTSVHMKAVYEFKCDGRKHWIEQKYSPVPVKKSITYDKIVTEDEKSGYFLMASIYKDKDVIPAKSKDKIVNTLNRLVSSGVKSIVVIADICAFGTVAYKFMTFYHEHEYTQLALLDIESIEYVLLKTNMFKHVDIIDNTLELPVLMEKYYADILNEELIKHTGKGYSKGEKSKCLYENCCHETSKRSENCGIYIGGDKLKQIFKGTKYEYLTDIQLNKMIH